jgi:hypothetical protein
MHVRGPDGELIEINTDDDAFIEGPDKVVIELVEDRSGHPPITD